MLRHLKTGTNIPNLKIERIASYIIHKTHLKLIKRISDKIVYRLNRVF